MSYTVLAGLQGLQTAFIQNWLGPIFIIVVAAMAIMFIKNQEFRKLAAFVVIAAIVGLLIYSGDWMFGADGKLTKTTKDIVETVNVIVPYRLF